MGDFYGTAIKKPIPVKWYDLTKCPRDEDGDYLDDEGQKLTFSAWIDAEGKIYNKPNPLKFMELEEISTQQIKCVKTLENKYHIIHEDGFILIGIANERWCIRRDIFLETYEIETKNSTKTISEMIKNPIKRLRIHDHE